MGFQGRPAWHGPQARTETVTDVEFLAIATPPSHDDRVAAAHDGDR